MKVLINWYSIIIHAGSKKHMKKINEEIKFTEEETVELLKLTEKEILVLILSELKKITANTEKISLESKIRCHSRQFSYQHKACFPCSSTYKNKILLCLSPNL